MTGFMKLLLSFACSYHMPRSASEERRQESPAATLSTLSINPQSIHPAFAHLHRSSKQIVRFPHKNFLPLKMLPSSSSSSSSSQAELLLYKQAGIVLLTLQQASMPLMARSARDRDNPFITTVNVLCMDLMKLAACATLLISCYGKASSFGRFLRDCRQAIVGDPLETAKVCAPSLLYNVQNNLYYVALSHLESTTFCVLYQLKILTTALMLRWLLGKRLSGTQWTALLVLVIGVAIVQAEYEPPATRSSQQEQQQSPMLGLLAVLAMCLTSAFAGVYLELVLKSSAVDVWMQNVRLALFGLLISVGLILAKDMGRIEREGMFVGFDPLVWLMTATNSVGGLLIAVVIKYADNILKAYAQAAAIVGAGLGSWLLFDFVPSRLFAVGTLLVAASVYLYNAHPATTTTKSAEKDDVQQQQKAQMITSIDYGRRSTLDEDRKELLI